MNPRISYQIDAEATGAAEVARLTGELDKLGKSVDPAVAARAQALAGALRDLGAKQEAVDAFTRLRRELDASKAAMQQAQAQAQELGRSLSGVANPTRQQVGQLEKLRDAVRASKLEVQAKTAALDQSRAKLASYGVSTNAVAQAQGALRQALRETSADARALGQQYAAQAGAAQASAATQVRSAGEIRKGISSISAQLASLQQLASVALGGSVVGQLAGDLSRTADQYANLAARIKLVTGEGAAFDSAFEGVFDVATRTNTSLEATGTLFARIAQAGKQFNLAQSDALAITQAINQATQLSGTSAQASEAAVTQLIQGLQSGVLRGEEFNSVMEQAPRLAQALADGLGVTTGELRKLAEAGTLTSATVIKALQGQAQTLAAEFEKLPPTVGRALTNLSTQWTRYIGETDQAGGVSTKAAAAINALAANLSTVAELAYRVGQAWVAYKAIDIAGTLIAQVTASRAAAVATTAEAAATAGAAAATTAHTGALGANTAAKAANAAASRGLAAAATGEAAARTAATAATGASLGVLARLAGVAGVAIAVGGDLIVSTFQKAGTWIGEGIAKLQGFKDRSAEVAAQEKATAEAAAAHAREQAAVAQQLQRSQEAALGLTKGSKQLVGEFDGLITKGESTAQALEKVGKSLELGDLQGIRDGITALDALEVKGKITGEQLRATLGEALKGEDLARFEAQVRTAFDATVKQLSNGSVLITREAEQAARRLQAALEAIDSEALRRAGLSVQELKTGFSEAATSALNDVDSLDKALERLGARGPDTAVALTGALDKALEAAKTEKAVQAVIERLEQLAKQGRITGEQLAEGLGKARQKIDDLKPGISSLDEALRTFGLKTRSELQATANQLGAAYKLIANDVTISLADKAKAFGAYRDAAVAANGGVESSEIKLQRQMLETQAAAKNLSLEIVSGMKQAKEQVDKTVASYQALVDWSRQYEGVGTGGITDSRLTPVRSAGGAANRLAGDGGANLSTLDTQLREGGSVQFPPPDGGQWVFLPDARAYGGTTPNDAALGRYRSGSNDRRFPYAVNGVGYWARSGPEPVPAGGGGGGASAPANTRAGGAVPSGGAAPAGSGAGAGAANSSGAVQTIVLQFGGRSATVQADANNATNLIALLQDAQRQLGS